ncbi:MAG: acylphosphatase [Firmicutes bacterium]|nr:acylphosphatase [Bacillota bacterium]
MIRQKVHFLGFVQGVGFRFTIARHAMPLKITGWVKNEYDGTVRAELQGEPANIDKLIDKMMHERFIRITRVDREDIPVVEGEKRFVTDY